MSAILKRFATAVVLLAITALLLTLSGEPKHALHVTSKRHAELHPIFSDCCALVIGAMVTEAYD